MRAAASLHVPHAFHLSWPGGLRAYWAVTTGVAVLAVWMGVFYAPVDTSMGLVQKLVYLHIPAAVGALLAAAAAFSASVAYIWTRARVWDAVAAEGARMTVLCGLIVLVTGMVWGNSYWGVWWTWSPKLTFTLILCVLYGAWLLLHGFISPFPRRAMVCAVYGAVAFLDVPLVYLSVRLLPDVHPTSLPLTGEMRTTLWVFFVLAALVCTGFIASPLQRRARRRSELGGAHV